jgi:outer membrane protein assembly factor BamD (BamD/ComL family)
MPKIASGAFMNARRLSVIGIFCGTALLSACGTNHGWSRASSADTIAAYERFLSKFPDNPHAIDARSRIAKLQDEQAWTTARIATSVQGYQQYLATEPNGAHRQAARDEIMTRERDAAWRTAQTNETPQSLQDFLNRYPSSVEATEARDRLDAIAGYRAEFGTARSRRLADRQRDALAKRFGSALPKVTVLEPGADE